ncbi:MAG: helix-hairpin-helix domain-containing protein [Anaerolineales bacterium]
MLAMRLLSEGGEGPNTELQWLLLVGIAFFFFIIIVGWWASSRKQEQVEVQAESKKSTKKDADDLTKIEGIGPKVVKVLKEAGITTFEELSHAKVGDLQKALDSSGLHMMSPESWVEQAKLAEKGDWQKLEKLQSELKGGRKAR